MDAPRTAEGCLEVGERGRAEGGGAVRGSRDAEGAEVRHRAGEFGVVEVRELS